MKHGGLGITDLRLLVESVYSTYKAPIEVLVGSLLGGTDLNYVAHKRYVRRASADGRKQRELVEKKVLSRRKELANRAVLDRLQRATYNGEWITALPCFLNGTDFSWEEFQDNLLLRYVIVPFNLPTDCEEVLGPTCFIIPQRGGFLAHHKDAAK